MKTDKLVTLGSVFLLGFAAGFIALDGERRALADELSAAKARENSVIVQAMENCPPPAVMDFAMIEMSPQALAREGVHVPPYQPPAENSHDSFDSFEDDVPF